jgi:hypothetical protein
LAGLSKGSLDDPCAGFPLPLPVRPEKGFPAFPLGESANDRFPVDIDHVVYQKSKKD